METINQQEFQKRYGSDSVNKFKVGDTISAQKFRDLSPTPSVNQNVQVKKDDSLFGKLSNIGEKMLSKPSQFLFGNTAKTVGGTIVRGIGGTQQIAGEITGNEKLRESGLRLQESNKGLSKSEAAFTLLELYPGGGLVSNTLKKLPGGSQSIKYISETLSKVPQAFRASAVKDISSVLSPTTKATKELTSQVAPEIAKRKIISTSYNGLLNNVEANLRKVGDNFDEVLSKIDGGKEFKIAPLKESLEQLKSSAYVKDRAGNIKMGVSGKPIAVSNNILKNVDELSGVLDEFGDKISFDSMRSLRQILDKEISQGGGFLKTLKEGTELEVKKSFSNSIRSILAKESPELAKINAEYAFWKKTKDVLRAGSLRQTGKKMSLATKATSIVGAATGGLKWAILAPAFEKLFNSTLWKTVSSANKVRLADAIVSDNNKIILEILKRFGIGVDNLNE